MSYVLKHSKGVLLVLLSGTLWGTIGIVVKYLYAVSNATALDVLYYRFIFALPALIILLISTQDKQLFRVSKKALKLSVLMGAMIAISQLCYFMAIRETGVAVATLVAICIAPIIVSLVSVFLLHEPLSSYTVFSLLLSIIGVALLIDFEGSLELSSAKGVGIALVSAATFAMVIVSSRFLASYNQPLQVNTIAILAGIFVLSPLIIRANLYTDFDPIAWCLLIYLGVATTALAYWFLVKATQTITATTASILTLIDPLVAASLAYLLFDEHLTFLGVIGALLLVASFVIAIRS